MSIRSVQTFSPSAIHIGTIAYRADILESLEEYCLEKGIQTGWVNLLGALSKATLSYYTQDTHQYVSKTFEGEFEIISGIGNISLKDGAPFGHIHLSLSNTEYGCIGGHLIKGSVSVFACEFIIYEASGPSLLFRCPDEETDLALWQAKGS